MAAIGTTEWLQEQLGVEGISPNRRKSQVLLAHRVLTEHLTEKQRVAVAHRGWKMIEGCRGTGRYETVVAEFLNAAVNGEPVELVRGQVPLDDALASFQNFQQFAGFPPVTPLHSPALHHARRLHRL